MERIVMPASASDGFVSPLPPTGRRGLRLGSPVMRRSNLDFRRGGDSNPRYPLGVQLLSREPDSAALAPLPYRNRRRGAGGIRTLGALRHSGFQDRLLRPLGHRSNQRGSKTYAIAGPLSISGPFAIHSTKYRPISLSSGICEKTGLFWPALCLSIAATLT